MGSCFDTGEYAVLQCGRLGLRVGVDGTITPTKVEQDGHGQHGDGRILLNDAANCKVRFLMRDIYF